jgi:hypothetical protein
MNMPSDWEKLKEEIDNANARGLEDCPEDILRVFEYDIVRTGAGTGGLMLGNWFEGATASRYLGPYYIYNILKLSLDQNISLEKMKKLMNLMMPKALGTVGLCGMETFARFTRETMACVNEMDNREDAVALLNSLYLYGSCINAWQNYRVKWGVSLAFPIKNKEDLKDMGSRADESYL